MVKWYCFKCKEEAEPTSLQMEYLGMDFSMDGFKCQKCGMTYLDEETVKEKVLKTQKMIEEKGSEG